MRLARAGLVLCLAVLWTPPLHGQDPPQVTEAGIEKGQRLYQAQCGRCHGMLGRGGEGPSLVHVDPFVSVELLDDRLRKERDKDLDLLRQLRRLQFPTHRATDWTPRDRLSRALAPKGRASSGDIVRSKDPFAGLSGIFC